MQFEILVNDLFLGNERRCSRIPVQVIIYEVAGVADGVRPDRAAAVFEISRRRYDLQWFPCIVVWKEAVAATPRANLPKEAG